MKPRTKFLIGGVLVLGTAGYLAASAIKDTGVYYLTPGELSAKTKSDPTFYETGVKVGARVAPPVDEISFAELDLGRIYAISSAHDLPHIAWNWTRRSRRPRLFG